MLRIGDGNYNDSMMQKLADKGNGNYGYIDTEEESRKLLVEQLVEVFVDPERLALLQTADQTRNKARAGRRFILG